MLHDVKGSALLTLKTARGQLDGIVRMVEEERYCVDISKQILSVQSLLKKANMEILKGHIKTCVKHAVEKGEGDEKIEEIFSLIDRYAKPGG
ncbi:MAG: metal-sensing transcriptional repressor [Nitrospinota bacterium]|nr:metal-sensing transcriptional repressor [Nitrospinota bacterium]